MSMIADSSYDTEPGAQPTTVPVESYNEWGRLREVVVGSVYNASFPSWHVALEPVLPENMHRTFQRYAGTPFPQHRVDLAAAELDNLVAVLEGEGVTVKRPTPLNFREPFGAPGWTSTGLYCAMPRDLLLVVGHEIIECPLAWRSRYFEVNSYKTILKEYFNAGAKWTSAPRPELTDELYKPDWDRPGEGGGDTTEHLVITDFEPTFDAADFIRLGRDIICQKSNVTNSFGIQWLRRHLGSEYNVHELKFEDEHPMHIDATFMPLCPGKILINPERVTSVPAMFKAWDLLPAPAPAIPPEHVLYMTSRWINMNILMLDEERVIVEAQDEPMIAAMKGWGFQPIPVPFRNFNSFGGSFHCATLDVRRDGGLESYF